MNECPTCGRFIKGDFCPYCDERVVDEDEFQDEELPSDSLVVVYSCDEQWKADSVISALEAEGIPAYKYRTEAVEHLVDNYYVEPTGEIVVMVDEDDAKRALDVIESNRDDLETEE